MEGSVGRGDGRGGGEGPGEGTGGRTRPPPTCSRAGNVAESDGGSGGGGGGGGGGRGGDDEAPVGGAGRRAERAEAAGCATDAASLLRELFRAESRLPPYNGAQVRKVVEEVRRLYEQSQHTLKQLATAGQAPDVAQTLQLNINYASMLRSKECLAAYVLERARIIESLRWAEGTVLSDETRATLSPLELEYFTSYSNLVAEYMQNEDVDLSVDISRPPKDLFIEVRIKDDLGEVLMGGGPVTLRKDTICFLPREDVQQFIREGKMEHIVQ